MDPDQMMRRMMQGMGMGMPMPMMSPFTAPNPMQSHAMVDPLSLMLPSMGHMMSMPFPNMSMTMATNGGGMSYCSSSVTSYTTDQHGRTQVYQQSNEVKQGPDGVKETKSSVRDSRTGHQELSIGHHIRDKGHIKKKSKNAYTNEEEDCEDFIGIDESEADAFEQNWQSRAQSFNNTNNYNQLMYHNQPRSSRNNRLALTSSANEDLRPRHSPSHRASGSGLGSIVEKVAKKVKKKKSKEPKE